MEIAEFASRNANICVIDIPVNLPAYPAMRDFGKPDFVAKRKQILYRQNVVKEKSLILGNILLLKYLIFNILSLHIP
jgi:hypothetical protein